MAFTVPLIEPALPDGLLAGDWIAAPGLESVLLRDRFLFATRRRLIASLPQVQTSVGTYTVPYYRFWFKTLPTATQNVLCGVVADDDCDVRLDFTGVGSIVLSTGGPGCYVDSIAGVPQDTWTECIVKVQSNTGGPVNIWGIYLVEQSLTDTDLP